MHATTLLQGANRWQVEHCSVFWKASCKSTLRTLDLNQPPTCYKPYGYVSQAVIHICLWLGLSVRSLSSCLTAPRPSCYVLWPMGSGHYVWRYNYYHYCFFFCSSTTLLSLGQLQWWRACQVAKRKWCHSFCLAAHQQTVRSKVWLVRRGRHVCLEFLCATVGCNLRPGSCWVFKKTWDNVLFIGSQLCECSSWEVCEIFRGHLVKNSQMCHLHFFPR